ncbi:KpsF/GutQ family sugar-phosphate isomerase [bacterium]|nr:KpsF/GutQ family sugar-phosphate isomerase [bacterium]
MDKKEIIDLAVQVIDIEANELMEMKKRVNDSFYEAVELMCACKGRIIVTGMGKSGLIGRKISATLASTGTPSLSLHPAEALHGDLGMVCPDDVLLALSNSGETEEIKQLLPTIKKIGAKFISVLGNINSTIAQYSDVVLDASVSMEACTLGLAPTSSTTAALVIGDALAICTYEQKGFSIEDFAFYHPAGLLGKRLLKVEDIMRTNDKNAVVKENTTVQETLIAITKAHAGAALIIDNNEKLTGFFTDGDFRRAIENGTDILKKPVSMFMAKNPYCIQPDCLAMEALKIIKEKKFDEMPVIDGDGLLLGLIDEGDLLGL